MAVNIVINKTAAIEEPVQETIFLNARESLDGNVMIFDHRDMDIVIMTESSKLLLLAKEQFSDKVYEAQDRLCTFLTKKGILEIGSIQGGNVYGSMEGRLVVPIEEGVSSVQTTMYNIWNFLKEEKEYFEAYEYKEEEEIEYLTEPDDETSTELGEVPHEEKKGSLVPGWVRGPYGMTTFYRY